MAKQPEAIAATTLALHLGGDYASDDTVAMTTPAQTRPADGQAHAEQLLRHHQLAVPPHAESARRTQVGRQMLTESCSERAPNFECGLACGLACGFGLAAASSSRRLPTAAPPCNPGWLPAALVTACGAAGTESYAARVVCRPCWHGRAGLMVGLSEEHRRVSVGPGPPPGMLRTVYAVRGAVRRHIMQRCCWSRVSATRPRGRAAGRVPLSAGPARRTSPLA